MFVLNNDLLFVFSKAVLSKQNFHLLRILTLNSDMSRHKGLLGNSTESLSRVSVASAWLACPTLGEGV